MATVLRSKWISSGVSAWRATQPATSLSAEIDRSAIIYGAPPERIRRSHRGAILFWPHARVFIVAISN